MLPLALVLDDTAQWAVVKPDLSAGERRALSLIGKVLDGEADEEPNRWYAFWKRRSARNAMQASTVEDRSAQRDRAGK